MVELAVSTVTSVIDMFTGSVVKVLRRLVGSAVFWLLVLAVHERTRPLELVQRALDWLGITWSTAPVANWIASRGEVIGGAAVLLATVAVAGVLYHATVWVNATRGPVGLAVAFVVMLQTDRPTSEFVGLIVLLAALAVLKDRRIEPALLALAGPTVYLAGPLIIVADVLGFNASLLNRMSDVEQRQRPAASASPREVGVVTVSG